MSARHQNPYQAPDSENLQTEIDHGYMHWGIILVFDIALVFINIIAGIIGYKVMPIYAAMFEGMEERLPMLTRISIHPISTSILPVAFLIFGLVLNFKILKIQKWILPSMWIVLACSTLLLITFFVGPKLPFNAI